MFDSIETLNRINKNREERLEAFDYLDGYIEDAPDILWDLEPQFKAARSAATSAPTLERLNQIAHQRIWRLQDRQRDLLEQLRIHNFKVWKKCNPWG